MRNEIDEPEDDEDTAKGVWADVPRAARDYVYATIDAMEAAAVRDTEEARMRASIVFEAKQLREGADRLVVEEVDRPVSDEELVALVRENAWRAARDALRALDPDYCANCGQVHEREKPHRDPRNMD